MKMYFLSLFSQEKTFFFFDKALEKVDACSGNLQRDSRNLIICSQNSTFFVLWFSLVVFFKSQFNSCKCLKFWILHFLAFLDSSKNIYIFLVFAHRRDVRSITGWAISGEVERPNPLPVFAAAFSHARLHASRYVWVPSSR